MSFRFRSVLLLLAIFTIAGQLWAATDEDIAFKAARENLDLTAYAKAEKDLVEFIQKFPESPRLPEAYLLQAEARIGQSNYAGAVELLINHQNAPGTKVDTYLFTIGEAYVRAGDYSKGAGAYADLLKRYPSSPRCLDACIREAAARTKLAQWPEVVQLLGQTNGIFQAVARTNGGNPLVFQGHVLLSEAQLERQNFAAAEDALAPFAKSLLNPTNAWRRQYLICRIQVAADKTEAALQSSSNLLWMAANTLQPDLQAESATFQARLLERLGRLDEAINAYTNNLADTIPPQPQREALLKISELSLARNKLGEATLTLNRFVTRFPQAASADLAWLTLGELRLRQYAESLGTNGLRKPVPSGAGVTNDLRLAQIAFETLTQKYPASPYLGKGFLNLGWCFWLSEQLPESQGAFQAAVDRLPASTDLARAHFKLADTQFRQKKFSAAVTNYSVVIDKFSSYADVKTNLLEGALYQLARAALEAHDLSAGTNALAKILQWFPNGFHTEGALLMAGQALSREGNPVQARSMFEDFLKSSPDALLRPEMELAIARTFEQEQQWTNVFVHYETWLATHTNHQDRPRAEYGRAWAAFSMGDVTNAFTYFTNFVARYPTNEFTPLGQWWIADHYFNSQAYASAENDFQLLARSSPASELAFEARMMAGRAAVGRQGWVDATDYFDKLWRDTNCPADLRFRALFALGDTFMSQGSTNKQNDYKEAFNAFEKIYKLYATNRLAVLALGEQANCLLQAAQGSSEYALGQYEIVLKSFDEVFNSPLADVTTRSIARVGLAVVQEKQAAQKTGPEQIALRKQALENYLDVFSRKLLRNDEVADPFWTKEAGLRAARLATDLQEWSQVFHICKRLCDLLPQLRPSLEDRMLKAQEHMGRIAAP